ncbi:hypothetical protein V1477_005428 [Vespula maculifrons]|uniref:Uncharacterized protein n=1 Tax=Vespula maculifrons TaxID=7453 RepID=A0ABD2CPK9_VESMC
MMMLESLYDLKLHKYYNFYLHNSISKTIYHIAYSSHLNYMLKHVGKKLMALQTVCMNFHISVYMTSLSCVKFFWFESILKIEIQL